MSRVNDCSDYGVDVIKMTNEAMMGQVLGIKSIGIKVIRVVLVTLIMSTVIRKMQVMATG
jgi:ribosomal protein L7Ae-like RNA K-turn-binding protein